MKKKGTALPSYHLDTALYALHKDASIKSDFGLDNSRELIRGGFGLYSSANIKEQIGPIKSQYFRISLVRAGQAQMDIGLETYICRRDTLLFGFPGQVFSLYDKSDDFLTYYMLFNEAFMAESLLLNENREQYPFLRYSGIQAFQLSPEEAAAIEAIILNMNAEIKDRKPDIARMLQLYIQMILVHAGRSYERQQLSRLETAAGGKGLYRRFVKLVGQHFLTLRKVSDYAELLNVSADYLNRAIKSQSAKTAGALIDEMLLTEAKAYLLHTELTNAEIAYHLQFSDPSHFNKFFKKQMQCTPLEYRGRS